MVSVEAQKDDTLRSEVFHQGISFERDKVNFRARWEEAKTELTQNILATKDCLTKAFLAEELLLLISQICTELHVGSLRADITLYKIAVANWKITVAKVSVLGNYTST